jgi:hypothetical protein
MTARWRSASSRSFLRMEKGREFNYGNLSRSRVMSPRDLNHSQQRTFRSGRTVKIENLEVRRREWRSPGEKARLAHMELPAEQTR